MTFKERHLLEENNKAIIGVPAAGVVGYALWRGLNDPNFKKNSSPASTNSTPQITHQDIMTNLKYNNAVDQLKSGALDPETYADRIEKINNATLRDYDFKSFLDKMGDKALDQIN